MTPRRSVAVAAVLLASLGACDESQHARYATFADAERAGAVARGWIPPFVPPTAVAIDEVHDVDLNTQRLRFRIPIAEVPKMTASMQPLALSAAWPPTVRSPELPGEWPSELTRHRITPRATLRLYRAPAAGPAARCLAVETDRGVVYAWSCDDRAS